MKIAIVTDDGKTICQHFGRATKYAVLDIQEGKILSRELRDKAGHHTIHALEEHHDHGHSRGHVRGMDAHSADKHARMVQSIQDCSVLLARGMGRGAKLSMDQAQIKTFQVDIKEIDTAVAALIDGSIDQYVTDQFCGEQGHNHHH
jgi:predicted Fe-Mo cluster-binding NifX family protein